MVAMRDGRSLRSLLDDDPSSKIWLGVLASAFALLVVVNCVLFQRITHVSAQLESVSAEASPSVGASGPRTEHEAPPTSSTRVPSSLAPPVRLAQVLDCEVRSGTPSMSGSSTPPSTQASPKQDSPLKLVCWDAPAMGDVGRGTGGR